MTDTKLPALAAGVFTTSPAALSSKIEYTDEGREFFRHYGSAFSQPTHKIELTYLSLPTRDEWPFLLLPTPVPVFREGETVRLAVTCNDSLLAFTLLVRRVEPNIRTSEPRRLAGGWVIPPCEMSRGPWVVTGEVVASA